MLYWVWRNMMIKFICVAGTEERVCAIRQERTFVLRWEISIYIELNANEVCLSGDRIVLPSVTMNPLPVKSSYRSNCMCRSYFCWTCCSSNKPRSYFCIEFAPESHKPLVPLTCISEPRKWQQGPHKLCSFHSLLPLLVTTALWSVTAGMEIKKHILELGTA